MDDVIGSLPGLGHALAALSPEDRERFSDGLDGLKATCRSGLDSLTVLALVYAAEARRQGREQLADLWAEVAEHRERPTARTQLPAQPIPPESAA